MTIVRLYVRIWIQYRKNNWSEIFFWEAKRTSLFSSIVTQKCAFQGYRRRRNEGSSPRRSRLFPPWCRQKSESLQTDANKLISFRSPMTPAIFRLEKCGPWRHRLKNFINFLSRPGSKDPQEFVKENYNFLKVSTRWKGLDLKLWVSQIQ